MMTTHRFQIHIYLLILFLSFSCSQLNDAITETNDSWTVSLPNYFLELIVPAKNPMTSSKVALGAKLFYDPALSADSTISCASCHLPQFAFTDRMAKSIGVSKNPTVRNSPTLVNLAFHPYFMFDGGIPTLELQAIAPLMHPDEMGFDLFKAAERLNNDQKYAIMSQKVFNEPLNAQNIAYALAAFQRSLLSYQSPYDAYLQGDKEVLSSEQLRGKELFFSDSLNCTACHSGFNFSDFEFYNIGLYQAYADKGRWRVTEDTKDEGKFKVPTLRNIELTAPYMHDGSVSSLEEVIDFKMSGGADHPIKSEIVHSFNLNEFDKAALIEFLYSLTDKEFVKREEDRRKKI